MSNSVPPELIGEYRLPNGIRRNDWIDCEYRGRIQVGGFTDGLIPWIKAKKGGRASLILCGDLVEAVKKESEIAVAYWFGVSITTVWQWRKILKTGRMTAGTTILFQENAQQHLTEEVQERGREKANSPESKAKMIETKKGQTMHPNTRAALLKATKKPKSEEWKRKASERGKLQKHESKYDWENFIPLMGKIKDRELSEKIGCSIHRLREKRRELGIEAYKSIT